MPGHVRRLCPTGPSRRWLSGCACTREEFPRSEGNELRVFHVPGLDAGQSVCRAPALGFVRCQCHDRPRNCCCSTTRRSGRRLVAPTVRRPRRVPGVRPPAGVPRGGSRGGRADRARVWDSQVVLEGMPCAACALTIEDAMRAVRGVLQADVSAATRRARVLWQPGLVRPSQWLQAVHQVGYRAMPAVDALAREQRLRASRQALWRWLVAGFCMMQVMMYAWPAYVAEPGDLTGEMEQLLRWACWVISLDVVDFCCGPFFAGALRDIRLRRVSMDLPVALGMAITFGVSTAGTFDPSGIFGREVFYDSLTMFVFFLLTGRWLELRLRAR